jgi:hypothetical protein
MNEDQECEQVEMILPAGMLAEFQSRAAKRSCTIEILIDEACERTMAKSQLARHAFLLRAQAIDDALSSGKQPPWPDGFDECLEVGLALSGLLASEDYLLEASGERKDTLEDICRQKGISYEEAVRQALDAHLAGGETQRDEEDQDDEGEEWKGAMKT